MTSTPDHEHPVYRAPMRARDRDAPPGAGAEHGLQHGLVGTGDALDRTPVTLDDAIVAATEQHGAKAGRMVYSFAAVPDGAFVWTHAADGTYRLGRLAGGWRYDDSAAAGAVGIHHVRAARWLDRPFGEDETPVAVTDTFARGGRNFQRIHGGEVEAQTARLWAESGSSAASHRP